MSKYFYIILMVILCVSCQNKKDLKEYTLCDTNKIYLPKYFQEDIGKNPYACLSKINLIEKTDKNEILSINFCTYGRNYGERDEFKILKLFFDETYKVIAHEIPEAKRLGIISKDEGEYFYFEYSYENRNNNRYILHVIYAYENGFINILYKVDADKKEHIDNMKNIVKNLQFKSIDNCINIKMLRMRCDDCEYIPDYW